MILAGTIAALANIVVICGSTASVGVNETEMSESDTEQFYWNNATKHGQYSQEIFAHIKRIHDVNMDREGAREVKIENSREI